MSGREFDNQYLTMIVLRGWTVSPSVDQKLNLVRGKYLLTINPIFTHASGIMGGRFSEFAVGMPSLDAVARNVDQPASGAECAQWPPGVLKVTELISLANLYTDTSKAGDVCVFPSSSKPVWFGSFFSGGATGSDYTITLSYDTADVNSLPKKGSPELKQAFTEVSAMLRTLELKPPIVISKVSPTSAPPGATVTVYGRGFTLFNSEATVSFGGVTDDLNAVIAGDGTSLTFQVPTSIGTASCQEGRVLIGEDCLPVPPNHVDVNDCPRDSSGRSNLCGIPIPPGIYQIFITADGVNEGPVMFTVTASKPTSVSITLMYPVYLVLAGDKITVRGSGFTANDNSVRIGAAVLNNLTSPDGKILTFRAPEPPENSSLPGRRIYHVSVFNADGESNSITLEYH